MDINYTRQMHKIPISILKMELDRRVKRNFEIASKLFIKKKRVSVRYGIDRYLLSNLAISDVSSDTVYMYDVDFPDRTYNMKHSDIDGIYECKE